MRSVWLPHAFLSDDSATLSSFETIFILKKELDKIDHEGESLAFLIDPAPPSVFRQTDEWMVKLMDGF